jgi:hypothetical protein
LNLDDFAMRDHTAMHADDLYELISDCAVNGKPRILTSTGRRGTGFYLIEIGYHQPDVAGGRRLG